MEELYYQEKRDWAVKKSGLVCLNGAFRHCNGGLNHHASMIAASVNLQISRELSMKATIITEHGLHSIFLNVDEGTTAAELEAMYNRNAIKVKEFEQLKNFIKSRNTFGFERAEFAYIERFQTYRNKIVHFNYNFSPAELSTMEDDIIHLLVHILGVFINDSRLLDIEDRKFMQEYIDETEYRTLMKNEKYVRALQNFIYKEDDTPCLCPICNNHTLLSSKKCLGCLLNLGVDDAFRFIECAYCRKEMVVYDTLNMEANFNQMRGLSLNCEEDTVVYLCSVCGLVYNMEGVGQCCTPDGCIHEV